MKPKTYEGREEVQNDSDREHNDIELEPHAGADGVVVGVRCVGHGVHGDVVARDGLGGAVCRVRRRHACAGLGGHQA